MKPATKSKSLIDATDEELLEGIRVQSERVVFSYNDVYQEIQRRAQVRQGQVLERLTKWAVILAALATLGTLASAAAAVITLFKG